jgi:hypothetical protein
VFLGAVDGHEAECQMRSLMQPSSMGSSTAAVGSPRVVCCLLLGRTTRPCTNVAHRPTLSDSLRPDREANNGISS